MTTDYVGSVVNVKLLNGVTIQGRVSKITAATLSLTDINSGNSVCTYFQFVHYILPYQICTS